MNDVINPRPFCRAGLHPMTNDNVWIKPSTKQRRCKACIHIKYKRKRGLYIFGDVWTDTQLQSATLPLLTMQKEKLDEDIQGLYNKLDRLKAHLKQVVALRTPLVEKAIASRAWENVPLKENEK